ncbi:uncharacterized protein LOC110825038 [Carica papaya]|uniref:uncharacterized protein LOC110825038 n=1 Tax=Carica papaya TaxID=3649 RepID=UPI000B8CB846|nr:uncharacterized protein LOC110825038 [Carica papaya]
MWSFASRAITGAIGLKGDLLKLKPVPSECSDDDTSLNNDREEGLECPVCWESFNIVENVPLVLWCGHTLCKNCVLGLQRAIVKFPTVTIHLPFFISCPWCNLLSLRLVYKGSMKFPCKNFFLLWMVESMNGDRSKSRSSFSGDQPVCYASRNLPVRRQASRINNRHDPCQPLVESSSFNHGRGNSIHNSYLNVERLHLSLRKSFAFFVRLTAKFPLVVVFLLMILYAIPASAAILALYILITFVFAVPSFLVLYFAFPSLDWLVREIIT